MTLPDSERGLYRPAVGIMLLNHDGRVFVGRRIDMPAGLAAWQMPQGGIDPGETPRNAALRELKEEVGTDRAQIVAELSAWLNYDLPAELQKKLWKGRYRGQAQKWFALRFIGEDSEIDLETEVPEFRNWRWSEPEKLIELIVPFKRDVYRRVLSEFGPLLRRWAN